MNKEEEVKEFQAFIVEEAKSKNKDPESYIKELGEEGLKEAYKRYKSKKTRKALHGIKLNYIKQISHKCADDEELVYFKKGGSVDCGCVKKKLEEGGKTPKKSPVDKFKNRKVQDQATKDSIAVNVHGDQDVEINKPGDYKKNKQGKVQWTPDRTKAPYKKEKGGNLKKNCGGSTLKLKKKGGEVCPKCGKVHAAGIGCTVAKFKMHRQGGNIIIK